MRHFVALAIAALVSMIPQTAVAEPNEYNSDAVRTMHAYGNCVADRLPLQARRVLEFTPGSEEEKALLRQIATESCVKEGSISFQPKLLRGVLAEAYFESDFGAIGNARRRGSLAPFPPLGADQIAALSDSSRVLLYVLDFATCIADAAPEDTVALLRTEPAGSAENAAFTSLLPTFGPCMTKDVTFSIVKPQLRGFLAEAAYRAAVVAAEGRT